MRKKIRNIIFLLAGGILGIIFLQTVYTYIYQGIIEETSNQNTVYHQIYSFLDPNNLSIFLTIMFFAGIMLVILFSTKDYE